MKTVVFDGPAFAAQRLEQLREKVAIQAQLKLVSVVHVEDPMGKVYTNLKEQAAQSVGIAFEKVTASFEDDVAMVEGKIKRLSERLDVNGILIQKPSQMTFDQVVKGGITYSDWWQRLTSALDPAKDVDCLTSINLQRAYTGESDFLPATARAIVSILDSAQIGVDGKKVVVVGKSELVGRPMAAYLRRQGAIVDLLGSKDILRDYLPQAEIVISATGKADLIDGGLLQEGVAAIDVGEPKGDFDFGSVVGKASFVTPVPGGVGPVTVVSLLENLMELATQ